MSRFAPKYSDEQRAGITDAILDDGLTAQQAVDDALVGALPELEPFHMPVGTARDLAGKERAKRAASDLQTPDGAASALEALKPRVVRLLEAELRQLEEQALSKSVDLRRVHTLARVIREMSSILKPERDPAPKDADTEVDLVTRLARQATATSSGA